MKPIFVLEIFDPAGGVWDNTRAFESEKVAHQARDFLLLFRRELEITVSRKELFMGISLEGWLTSSGAQTPVDSLGNRSAQSGCDRCTCGCKYWESDVCIDCGSRWAEETHGDGRVV